MSMKTSDDNLHTPGPWHLAGNYNWDFKGGYLGEIHAANGDKIYAGPANFHSLRGATREQAKANAQLIASAPELLAALEGCLRFMNEEAGHVIEKTGYARQHAREAIAKAKGEAQS